MKHRLWFPLVLCAISCAADPRSDLEPRGGDANVEDMMHAHVTQIFEEKDADESGSLSKTEVGENPWLMAHFDEADADHDGQLKSEEVIDFAHELHGSEQTIAEHIELGFEELDVDADGLLTLEEAKGHPLEHMFGEADTDASNTVSLDELQALAEKHHGEASEGHHGHRGAHPHP
jgi:hypothetical protein